MLKIFLIGVSLSVAVAGITPAAKAKPSTKPTAKAVPAAEPNKITTLFDRLGGKDAIKAVVDDLAATLAGDQRINTVFAPTLADANRLAGFKAKVVDQICQATGGPCKYQGQDMKTAHASLDINESQFMAFADDLKASLARLKIGDKESQELMAILAKEKVHVVAKKP